MNGDGLLHEALETVLQGRVFLPASVLGTNEIVSISSKTPETFGVKGRAVVVLYYLCQGYSNQEIARQGIVVPKP